MIRFEEFLQEKKGLTSYENDAPLSKSEADDMHHILKSQGFHHTHSDFPQQGTKESSTVTRHTYKSKSGSAIHVHVKGYHSIP